MDYDKNAIYAKGEKEKLNFFGDQWITIKTQFTQKVK